jgi:hypothetical protein
MQSCQVCGRSFDPLEFQIVVPELGRGFDRIDCAKSARAMASPGSRFAATPLLALATPAAAVAFPARPRAPRVLGSTAATLGLLAAGTAAAALLWVRVVGTDTSSYTLGRLTAPPAFGHDRVQSQVEAAPATPGPAKAGTVTVERVVTVPQPTGGVAGLAPTEPLPASPPTSGPDRSSRAPVPTSRPAKETGEGHPKVGIGHLKHGEADGVHSPGHGKGVGKGSKPEGKANTGGNRPHGHGHGHGHGQGHGQGRH